MHEIVQHWLLWAKTMSAIRVLPFLRMDFLLQRNQSYGLDTENPGKMEEGNSVKVWTGEVSELGVAVELQGMHSHESRDLVMDAVIASMVSPPWSGGQRHNGKVERRGVGNTWRDASPTTWRLTFTGNRHRAFLAVAEVYMLTLNAELVLSSRIIGQTVAVAEQWGRLLAAQSHKVLFLRCLTMPRFSFTCSTTMACHCGESCLWRQCCKEVRVACR